MRVLRNPVAQFLAAGLVLVAGVASVSDQLSRRAAEREAIADARALTEVLAHSVAEPALPPGLSYGASSSASWFDGLIGDDLDVEDIELIKIWNADGRIVWSDDKSLIGESFELSPEARSVLESGTSKGEITDLRNPDNRYELKEDGLLEVYTRIDSPEDEPLLFEVYYSRDVVADTTAVVLRAFRPISVGGALLVGLLTVPLLWGLNRRLGREATAREHLLRAAVDASEEERRRIARDLHEGLGHRLRGAADAVAEEARDERTPVSTARRLLAVDDDLRGSAEALRSLVLEIYPPGLDAQRLGAAIDDLVVPAAKAGIDVSVEVEDLGAASDDAVALVWRVAREGVRNAVRHARGTSLAVSVRRRSSALVLRVADDGVGFVPGAFRTTERFGLRGLEDLAREAGGRLSVSTGPGRGTVLTLEVPTS